MFIITCSMANVKLLSVSLQDDKRDFESKESSSLPRPLLIGAATTPLSPEKQTTCDR